MSLGPRTQAYCEYYINKNLASVENNAEFDIRKLRQSIDDFFKSQLSAVSPLDGITAKKEKLILKSGTVNSTIYKPDSAVAPLPVIVFHPGGGFALDMADLHAHICMQICQTANAAVVCIQPPLSPEHKLPAILDAAYEATKHYYQQASHYGFLSTSLTIAGYSLGGTLATLITAKSLQDKELNISKQIIVSGVFDLAHSPQTPNDDFMFNLHIHRQFVTMCLPEGMALVSLKKNHDLSPLNADFHQAPPTYLITGEHDAFKQDSEKLYAKLLNDDVKVKLITQPGQIHNTLLLYPLMSDGENPAITVGLLCQ
jgi:acetyl esterase